MKKTGKRFAAVLIALSCITALQGCGTAKKENDTVKTEAESVSSSAGTAAEEKEKAEGSSGEKDSDVSEQEPEAGLLDQVGSLKFSPDEADDYKEILEYFRFDNGIPAPNPETETSVEIKYTAEGYEKDSYTGITRPGVAWRELNISISNPYGQYTEEMAACLKDVTEYWKKQGVYATKYQGSSLTNILLDNGTRVMFDEPLDVEWGVSIGITEGEPFELTGTVEKAVYDQIDEGTSLTGMMVRMEDGALVEVQDSNLINDTYPNPISKLPWLNLPEQNLEAGNTVEIKGWTFERGESTYPKIENPEKPIRLFDYLGAGVGLTWDRGGLSITEISVK